MGWATLLMEESVHINNKRRIAMEMITITKSEYDSLIDDAHKLQCLEGAGVDNWDGYDFAMEEYNKDESEE